MDASVFMEEGFDEAAQREVDFEMGRSAAAAAEVLPADTSSDSEEDGSEEVEGDEEVFSRRRKSSSRKRIRSAGEQVQHERKEDKGDESIELGELVSRSFPAWKLSAKEGNDRLLNQEAYRRCWKKMNEIVQEMLRRTMDSTLDAVANFFDHDSGNFFMKVAALVSGIDLGDHQTAFTMLRDKLEHKLSCDIAFLRPANAKTTQSSIKEISAQLTKEFHVHAISKSKEDGKKSRRPNMQREENCDLDSRFIQDAHSKMPEMRSTTILKRREVESKKTSQSVLGNRTAVRVRKNFLELEEMYAARNIARRVVIVVEDAENIDKDVLSELVTLLMHYHDSDLHEHFSNVHVVLGLRASTFSGVHGLLHQSETARLNIRQFKVEQGRSILDRLCDEYILNDKFPLRVGPKVMDKLSQIFLEEEYSFQSFMRSLKFLVIKHFSEQQCSHYGCPAEWDEEPFFRDVDRQVLLELPSVKSYLSRTKVSLKKAEDEDEFLATLVKERKKNREKWWASYEKVVIANRILQPNVDRGFRKSSRAAYVHLLSDVNGTEQDISKRIESCSLSTLKSLLDAWDDKQELEEFEQLHHEDLEEAQRKQASPQPGKTGANKKKAFRRQAMQSLEQRIEESTRARSFAKDLWLSLIAELKHPLPLEELFMLRHSKPLDSAFNADHRGNLLRALAGNIENSDTCILYQILEGHKRRKTLSLLEWYEEFCSAIEGEDSEQSQARFMHASTELQTLGICKHSNRMANNVTKLVFGPP